MMKRLAVRHELIGRGVRVLLSPSRGLAGVAGTVVDETKNTLVVQCANGEKIVPKAGCMFEFDFGGKRVRIAGDGILFRPEDRPKKVK